MSLAVSREIAAEAETAIRSELDRILASPEFRNAERLTRLLRHVVERTLEGATDRLKESLLGREVFDRIDFDPRIDPIVRVEASRLRKRLDDFYRRSGCPAGIGISLPKGTYAASFDRQTLSSRRTPELKGESTRRLAVAPLGKECAEAANELIHHALQRFCFSVVPWTVACAVEAEAVRTAMGSDIDVLVTVFQHQTETVSQTFFRATDVRKGLYLASACDTTPREPSIIRFLEHVEGRGNSAGVRSATSQGAYNLYLKGRYHWNLRTEAGLWKAVDYFQQSMTEDPGCALACAGLADAYTLLANYGAVAPDEVRPKAKEFALRGMELDASLAEAHTSLAHVHATYEWDWQTAELEYLTAIRGNASYATAHHWYAITLLAPLRRFEEAIEEIRRARECDAISLSIRRDEGLVQLYSGDAETAHDTGAKLLALDTRFAGSWWLMGLIAEVQQRYDAAAEAFRRSVELSVRHPMMLGALGHAYGLGGCAAEAFAVLAELEQMCGDRYVPPSSLALVHIGLGRLENAFSYLSRAMSLRSYDLVSLQADPRYEPLRSFAAYDQLLQTLGFKERQGGVGHRRSATEALES